MEKLPKEIFVTAIVAGTVVPTMIVGTAVPTRVVGTAAKDIFVPSIIVGTVVPIEIVGTAVPTIIVLTAYYWKSCVVDQLNPECAEAREERGHSCRGRKCSSF